MAGKGGVAGAEPGSGQWRGSGLEVLARIRLDVRAGVWDLF